MIVVLNPPKINTAQRCSGGCSGAPIANAADLTATTSSPRGGCVQGAGGRRRVAKRSPWTRPNTATKWKPSASTVHVSRTADRLDRRAQPIGYPLPRLWIVSTPPVWGTGSLKSLMTRNDAAKEVSTAYPDYRRVAAVSRVAERVWNDSDDAVPMCSPRIIETWKDAIGRPECLTACHTCVTPPIKKWRALQDSNLRPPGS